ncbi:rna-directed dna polymerase from mobile element jockey-like [Limosa lapponica baueri]|uniref:Rna-directed dna polymerase from mobile element jockey-like n=1 Tax=Limosa lapponica baueri TaxID=1758121 RepID=A0A2I0U5T4_LIMLA|nr:rna-directed dna polymerase from mobile element jockey-like [Limosa lapponica baueri]
MLYVKVNLECIEVTYDGCGSPIKSLWVKIKGVISKRNLTVGIHCQPPNQDKKFLECVEDCILIQMLDVATRNEALLDTSKGRATLQEDMDRLEEWTNKNLMKFNKDECNVLHLGKHDPGVQHRLGSTWLGSSSVERDLGVLVDSKPSKSEQCTAAAAKQANRMLGCINMGITTRDKDIIIPLYSMLVRLHQEMYSVLVPTIQKRCGQAGEAPEKGHKEDQRTGKPAI